MIDLKFSSSKINRNAALRDIADELCDAFDAVRAGLGTRICDEAKAQFPKSPISFGIKINEFAPQQTGKAHFTIVWGELAQIDDSDPENPVNLGSYGYWLDFLMDLSGTSVTEQQFKQAVRNRWDLTPKRKVLLEAWKRAKNGDSHTEIDVTDTPTAQVTLVDPQFPKHRFAGS